MRILAYVIQSCVEKVPTRTSKTTQHRVRERSRLSPRTPLLWISRGSSELKPPQNHLPALANSLKAETLRHEETLVNRTRAYFEPERINWLWTKFIYNQFIEHITLPTAVFGSPHEWRA